MREANAIHVASNGLNGLASWNGTPASLFRVRKKHSNLNVPPVEIRKMLVGTLLTGEQEICLRCGSPFDPLFHHRCAVREFDISDLRVLARETCTRCHGTGVRRWKKAAPVPCGCALRKVFRDCLRTCRRFDSERNPNGDYVIWLAKGQPDRKSVHWWRKGESYSADFHLIAKRELHRRQLVHRAGPGDRRRRTDSHASTEWCLFRLHEILSNVVDGRGQAAFS